MNRDDVYYGADDEHYCEHRISTCFRNCADCRDTFILTEMTEGYKHTGIYRDKDNHKDYEYDEDGRYEYDNE